MDVDSSDKEGLLEELHGYPPTWRRREVSRLKTIWHKVALAAATVGLLVVVCLVTYTVFPKLENFSGRTGRELGHCGSNVEEAREQGCVFDYLSYVWVRPPCFYPDLLEGYQNRSGVQWYTDPSLEEQFRIPDYEIERGDHPIAWAPRKFHSMHCAFTVSKTHYALANHQPIDSRANSFEHTEHCQMILLDEMPECTEGKCDISRVSAKFSTCGWV
ncbi:hypothetical protein NHJ13734_009877 [Beauveria thailandica]